MTHPPDWLVSLIVALLLPVTLFVAILFYWKDRPIKKPNHHQEMEDIRGMM